MYKLKIFKNISWLFIDKIIRIFLGLFVSVWVARYLGPENYGILNYSLAFISLFVIFYNLGLEQILVREIVKYQKLKNFYLGSAFLLKLIGGIIAFFIVLLYLFFGDLNNLKRTIIFILSFTFLFKAFDVIDYFFQSEVESKYVVIARNSAFIFSSILKILFIFNHLDVRYFALAFVLDSLIASIFLVYFYIKKNSNLKWKFSKKISKKLLKYSWSLAISAFIITIYTKIDQIMIGNMLNDKEVGLYSVAVNLSNYWLIIPSIFVSTFMPYFIKIRKENYSLYEQQLISFYSFLFWLGISVSIFIMLFGEKLIILLFGVEYKHAYSALVINIWNGIFISLAVARGIWLIGENLQKYRLYNNILAVILNVIANYILIPIYGIKGAAFATLLTQGAGTMIFPFFWKKMRISNMHLIIAINPYSLIKGIKWIR